jgi:2-polyprenyl-3-methyl-5-hydroxy-6-metoxy-1,4-benzoquinol methylase
MKEFSHATNFPGYMHRVRDILQNQGKSGQKVLDMPAGSGKFGDSLKELGFNMTYGDIKHVNPTYWPINTCLVTTF